MQTATARTPLRVEQIANCAPDPKLEAGWSVADGSSFDPVLVKTLIERGADVNLKNERGTTPLMMSLFASAKNTFAGFGNLRYLLWVAIFHSTITLLVFALGRAKLFPELVDSNGVARFASDSDLYLADAVRLVNQLQQAGIADWASAPSPLHTKLYSLVFAALGPLVGFNILAAEPLNLVCYVATIFLVFKLGTEISDARTGRFAAILVAVWPTFLLHSSQILKDPLFISLLLGLIFVATCCLTRSFSRSPGLWSALLSGALAMLLWFVKPDLWVLTLIVVLLSAGFQCLRFIRVKKIASGNLIVGIALLVIALGVPVLGPRLILPYRNLNPHPILPGAGTGANQVNNVAAEPDKPLRVKPPSKSSPPLTKLRERIAWARYLFVSYPGTSSNIDADVVLESWGEVIRYLPRAAQIGLLAPFPNMWLASGAQVSRLGRALSGLEMLTMYLVMALAVWGLWKRRDQLAIWFLVTIATLSVIVLGLVVANIGALYRMRYPFWMLLIIVGFEGALRLQRNGAEARQLGRAL